MLEGARASKRAKMAAMDVDVALDENLHSRQLAVYGRESMRRMATSNILVSGLKGLGVEIAKNVILAGVKAVTLHDPAPVALADLSAQFYLTPEDVGKGRAAASQAKLHELNSAVAVTASAEPITEAFLSKFQVVVFTDLPLATALQYDAFCRAQTPPIAFIRCETRGVCASVFTDFGPAFTVFDADGENPHSGIVAAISNGSPALVNCVEDERLEFQDGELVVFSEVKGMTQLNDGVPRRVSNCKPFSFTLEVDTSGFRAYERGGIVAQVKQPKTLAFKSLKEALAEPGEFLLSDFAKLDRAPQLHVGFQALDAFAAANGGRLPRPGNPADAAAVLALAQSLNAAAPAASKVDSLDEEVIRKMAMTAAGDLSPMAAMFGGFVGQEVIKAISGKFSPLQQWFHFDSFESLPDPLPSEAELAPAGGRYDGQLAVFGRALQKQLAETNVFLVGAGALGCELIKNFALMGLACGDAPAGAGAAGAGLTLTDDDTIEKSNLSRQFLFRDWNIGQAKSTVAAAAARAINPALRVAPLQNRVSPETETVFDDAFWERLDLVVNALDNVNARLYVDSRCVYFQKPLLESGTLGTKANTQMVIPHLTENYGASRDPPEKSAPMCTLHSFPHNIDHCLTWARSEFEGLLDKQPQEANAYLRDRAAYAAGARGAGDAQARESLERVVECLVTERPSSYEDCVAWARKRFQEYFHNRIAQLTYTFPEDTVTSTGAPFWSAPKRFPRMVGFDAADKAHAEYVQAAANLKAEVYGLPRPAWANDPAKVAAAAAAVVLPAFAVKAGVTIETDPTATADKKPSMHADDGQVIDSLLSQLEAAAATLPPDFRVSPVTFEKDDDSNFHMALIAGLANMRARNYGIGEVDKLQAKLIAGRIIPAIATTTAMATGLVCLELYKVLLKKPLEAYRNTFANLALPLFAMAEPIPPKALSHDALKWTLWDRWVIEGDVTVQQTLDWFSSKGISAYSISCGQSMLYSNIFPKHKDRLGRKMSELAVEVAKLSLGPTKKHFDIVVACENDNGDDLDVPLVSIKFR